MKAQELFNYKKIVRSFKTKRILSSFIKEGQGSSFNNSPLLNSFLVLSTIKIFSQVLGLLALFFMFNTGKISSASFSSSSAALLSIRRRSLTSSGTLSSSSEATSSSNPGILGTARAGTIFLAILADANSRPLAKKSGSSGHRFLL